MRRLQEGKMFQTKSELRKHMEALKRSVPLNIKEEYDKNIFKNVINSSFYKNASRIFIFVSYNYEADTHNIIKYSLNHGKIICVPKIISKKQGMKAVCIEKFEDLKTGTYGILEPAEDSVEIEKDKIDTIFLPGLAFDLSGGRIGYGGGFYDRFISDLNNNISKVAICYSFQVIDKVTMEFYDQSINGIITEKCTHTIN